MWLAGSAGWVSSKDSQSRQRVKYGYELRETRNHFAGEGQQQFVSQSVKQFADWTIIWLDSSFLCG
jgi:hypothetical protein